MGDLKDKLIQAYKDGKFFEFIQGIYYQDKKGEKELSNLLTDLHNSGKFDLVGLFKTFKNTPEKHDFFTTRQVHLSLKKLFWRIENDQGHQHNIPV